MRETDDAEKRENDLKDKGCNGERGWALRAGDPTHYERRVWEKGQLLELVPGKGGCPCATRCGAAWERRGGYTVIQGTRRLFLCSEV